MRWLHDTLEKSLYFMPHGHCYLWIPWLLWLHVISDALIGIAYLGISLILWALVRRIRLPFSPVFIAFGLFIGLCGATHFVSIWNVWQADYILSGLVKGATALASVATAIGLFFVRPQIEELVHTARLSEERRVRLESTHAELEALFARVKELDDLKSQFFANVSHELRTPLALILGPARALLNDDTLTDAQRRQLGTIDANASMLARQVNDLLDLARLDFGKGELNYAAVDTVTWFRRLVSQFEVAAEQRSQRLEVDAPAQLLAEVDIDKLERVAVNLLSNALKFTPPGGVVQAFLQGKDDELQLILSDSGPGIPEQERHAVFERFRQIHGDDARVHGGTGLGLAIVREFVSLHGGTVTVDEAPLGGACFTVSLPRWAPKGTVVRSAPGDEPPAVQTQAALRGSLHELMGSQEDPAAGSRPYVPGRPDILVVEDNPAMQDFIVATLHGSYNVATASDGVAGAELAQQMLPDLIVTDMMMPGMTGEQLIGVLRGNRALDAVPILLLTAKADDALRVRILQAGAQDYLTKPFHAEELLARAGNLIATKRAGDVLRLELTSLSTNIGDLASEVATRNRQLNTALQAVEVARQQAEQGSAAKSAFLGMVSHEMRTPLATVMMNLQMLERGGEAFPEALRPRLERAARAARQMASLVEGLLEYTRVESGRLIATSEELDLAAIAREVLEDFRQDIPEQVQLSLEQPEGVLPPLQTDPRLLRVLIGNLVGNALKFTPEGHVTVRLGLRDGAHTVEVEDTGTGIEARDLGRIFEPFERLEPVRRKSTPGVGLGLTLVRQIMKALGGGIDVTSAPGQGSRFMIWFPPAVEPGDASEVR